MELFSSQRAVLFRVWQTRYSERNAVVVGGRIPERAVSSVLHERFASTRTSLSVVLYVGRSPTFTAGYGPRFSFSCHELERGAWPPFTKCIRRAGPTGWRLLLSGSGFLQT